MMPPTGRIHARVRRECPPTHSTYPSTRSTAHATLGVPCGRGLSGTARALFVALLAAVSVLAAWRLTTSAEANRGARVAHRRVAAHAEPAREALSVDEPALPLASSSVPPPPVRPQAAEFASRRALAPSGPAELLLRVRRASAEGTLAARAAELREALRDCAEQNPLELLVSVQGELDPATVRFVFEAFLVVRRAEQVAQLAPAMADLAARHPSEAHQAGALRWLGAVLWHHREKLTPGSEDALAGCAWQLAAGRPVEVRSEAARMLSCLADRPEVACALEDFVASGDHACAAARAEALGTLLAQGGADTAPLALARLCSDPSPGVRAAAAAGLCRLSPEEREGLRAGIADAGAAVLRTEADPALRLPVLIALALLAPDRARPFLAAAPDPPDGAVRSALAAARALPERSASEPDAEREPADLGADALRSLTHF